MSTIQFITGATQTGKTLKLIPQIYHMMTIYGRDRLFVVKSSVDKRADPLKLKSATGLEFDCDIEVDDKFNFLSLDLKDKLFLFIDEIQFFSEDQMEQLMHIAYKKKVKVVCCGLSTSFQGVMFNPIKRLYEIADDISVCQILCSWCSNKENMKNTNGKIKYSSRNIRISKSETGVRTPVLDGEEVLIGGSESYVPVCGECFYNITHPFKEAEL